MAITQHPSHRTCDGARAIRRSGTPRRDRDERRLSAI